jgi:hypothetical protein
VSFVDKLKESLPSSVAHQIWEDDELKKAAPDAVVVVSKARTPTPGSPKVNFDATDISLRPHIDIPTSYAPALSNTASDVDVFTQALKAATDFDKTDVGKQVAKEMKPLEGMPLNESQKIGIALKAGAEEGLTGESIISTIDRILVTLDGENNLRQVLDSIAITGLKVKVDGYTDNTGSAATNTALSAARAQEVKLWLQSKAHKNFPDSRFIGLEGHGPSDPVGDNSTDSGRAANRRVHIALID